MKKTILTMILVITLLIVPIKANALEINVKTGDLFQIATKNETANNVEFDSEESNQVNGCSGDDSLLGSVNDPDSVAWLLQQIFNYIKILGPLLVVVLSSVEFAKVIIESDDETMAKAQKKLITRIILAACLFFIPTIVSAALDLFGITSDATCGLE